MRRNKAYRVNTMYGADGRLRTSYFEGDTANIARKHVKSFEKELSKYEKDFAMYASLDIEDSKVHDLNTKYIFDKLGIAEKYVDFIPEGDMADCMGEEMTAIAGNKSAQKFGIKSKIASKFQPFLERQAQKHPKLQALSDRVTKAANGGRMPLTADSAAMMRIAFDKKYYRDCRRPGANIDELQRQHSASIANLTKIAKFDGVEPFELSTKFAEKLITQMQIDESLTDIYAGMADGAIRLADSKPVINSRKEIVKVGGKVLYEQPQGFVSEEKDKNGKNEPLDAWAFEVREPQTVDDILQNYQTKFDKFAKDCQSEADLKRMIAGNTYANLERNAKVFAEADCPEDAAMFKYEFARCNLASCKKWAIEHDHKSPYADIVVPPPWSERVNGNSFLKSYSTDDYYSINDRTELHNKAAKDVSEKNDGQLALTMADECKTSVADLNAFAERMSALEAENKALKEKVAKLEKEGQGEIIVVDTEREKRAPRVAAIATTVLSSAEKLKREIMEQYNSHSETILSVDAEEVTDAIDTDEQPALETTAEPVDEIDVEVEQDVTSELIPDGIVETDASEVIQVDETVSEDENDDKAARMSKFSGIVDENIADKEADDYSFV